MRRAAQRTHAFICYLLRCLSSPSSPPTLLFCDTAALRADDGADGAVPLTTKRPSAAAAAASPSRAAPRDALLAKMRALYEEVEALRALANNSGAGPATAATETPRNRRAVVVWESSDESEERDESEEHEERTERDEREEECEEGVSGGECAEEREESEGEGEESEGKGKGKGEDGSEERGAADAEADDDADQENEDDLEGETCSCCLLC